MPDNESIEELEFAHFAESQRFATSSMTTPRNHCAKVRTKPPTRWMMLSRLKIVKR